jgi:hypothetical protein
MRKLAPFFFLGAAALAIVVACGSSGDSTFGDQDGGDNGTSGGTSSGTIGSSSGGVGDSGLGKCATETQAGKQLPLDLFIMLDTSGSMNDKTGPTASGPTKLSAVRTALTGFINDPKSAGIGVGLQTFPIDVPGTPASCTSSSQCTVSGTNLGQCTYKACVPSSPTAPLKYCDSDSDCGTGSSVKCRVLGTCALAGVSNGYLCLYQDPTYGVCGIPYSCTPFSGGGCDKAACFEASYSPPKVAIGALPGNAAQLLTAITNATAGGGTPTAVALQSALDIAKTHATANPGHAVAVVLATDGLPTLCTPTDATQIATTIAAPAVAGTPSIKTFVIGVFTDADKTTGTTNLNALASGGGTGSAFIISTSGNVTTQFQAALDTIRGTALPCDYTVPTPESGTPDYDKVNVQLTSSSGSTVIPYKQTAASCDPTAGGWYYDADPSTGATPKTITLCPASCSAVKQAGGGAQVDVVLGCKTIVQ